MKIRPLTLLLPLITISFTCRAQENSANAPSSRRSAAASSEPAQIKRIEDLKLKSRSFTFVRLKYSVNPQNPGHAGNDRWSIDYPESDRHFSAWFEKKTGVKADAEGKVLPITAPELKGYPFAYIVEPGRIFFSPEEVSALRTYLLGGGFLMLDDFWGEKEWAVAAAEFKKVFPDQEPVELSIEHPIFHWYYDIKQKPQVPNVVLGIESQFTGITWERADAKEPHFRGLFDAKGRLTVIFCHNTDLGDGWEHYQENAYFSREFSRNKAFPMGINIVLYALSNHD